LKKFEISFFCFCIPDTITNEHFERNDWKRNDILEYNLVCWQYPKVAAKEPVLNMSLNGNDTIASLMETTREDDDVDDWTCSDVIHFLESSGCPKHIVKTIEDNSIDGYMFRRLLHMSGKKVKLSGKRKLRRRT